MIPLVYNDYIRQTGSGNNFNLKIDPMPSTAFNYHEESVKTAEYIYSNKQGKVYLLYSGGTDSEYTLNLFLSLGMDVTPVIIKLNPGYNDQEIKYAFDFCQAKGITPLVVDIDFDHFVKSGRMLDLAKEMQIGIYHYSATADVVGKLDGTVLLGDGEPYIRLDQEEWKVEISEYEFGIGRYFQNNNIHGTPYVLRYRPEQMVSFLLHDRIKGLAFNHYPGKLGSHSSKVYVYNDSGFNIPSRTKLHGYELIEQSEIFKHEDFGYFHHYSEDPMFSVPYWIFYASNNLGSRNQY